MHPFFSLLLLCYGTQATVSLFVAYDGLSMVTMTMKVTMMIPMKTTLLLQQGTEVNEACESAKQKFDSCNDQ